MNVGAPARLRALAAQAGVGVLIDIGSTPLRSPGDEALSDGRFGTTGTAT